MTQIERIRRMLPRALWIEAGDLPVEDALGRRLDCANLGACTSTFTGPRRRDEPEWRCPRECPDFEARESEMNDDTRAIIEITTPEAMAEAAIAALRAHPELWHWDLYTRGGVLMQDLREDGLLKWTRRFPAAMLRETLCRVAIFEKAGKRVHPPDILRAVLRRAIEWAPARDTPS